MRHTLNADIDPPPVDRAFFEAVKLREGRV